ncbi:hypothetical protein CRG98_037730 [Punica granatum]|uniref:Uncharacterized protein n=1 Tax=Punica granatum TaxID=22663 RepID=A0A2I0IDX8_PUNGR|nr:hypothetical protein CRG98_037730 [Punica granatum]
MFYLALGCEERVGKEFESRVTRLNAWKGAQVQRMHVRARMGAREDVRRAAGRAGARLGVQRVYCSPESTSFTRNHLNDLK